MPSTREIRRRIRSVKNMAQMTKALQMVASSRMFKAQERVRNARPYADQLRALVSRMANVAGPEVVSETPLLAKRPIRRIGILLLSPDRGQCGALPSNINRKAATTALELRQEYAERDGQPEIDYVAVGRKGRDFIVRTQQNLVAEFTQLGARPSMNDASAISQVVVDAFLAQQVDVVYLVYPKFVSTVSQVPTAVQLLPVEPPAESEGEATQETGDYIYEPNGRDIYEALLPRYVDVQIYQALLESVASEESARMVAMKNATDNANELVQDLTLTYNKARQTAITTQILEVVSGAEAL